MDFHLYSEVKFRPVTFEPVTENVRFRAVNPGLEYFLQLGTGNVMKVDPDQVIAVPGVSKVTIDTHINVQWELCPLGEEDAIQLPLDIYPSTLAILDLEDTKAVRVVSNMNPAVVDESAILNAVLVHNRKMHRSPKIDDIYIDESGRRYRLTYVRGPGRGHTCQCRCRPPPTGGDLGGDAEMMTEQITILNWRFPDPLFPGQISPDPSCQP